jgi:hypothetical protein
VHLVGVRDAPVVLSHNEQTSDEYDNTYVQWGLTSWYAYYGQVKTSSSNDTPQTTFFIPVTYLE